MMPDGLGWLFVPSGLQDGPMPTHYEPVESPVENQLYGEQINPTAKLWHSGPRTPTTTWAMRATLT
jgi:formate dehydrogenase major subunit